MIKKLNEITMVWRFDGGETEYCPNPAPLQRQDEQYPCALEEVKAVLYGRTGNLRIELKQTKEGQTTAYIEHVRALLVDAHPSLKSEGSCHNGRNGFGVSYTFEPRSGQQFTETADEVFAHVIVKLFGSEIAQDKLPVPDVTSKAFYQLGPEKIPFGVAVALDTYRDGGFQKIRKTNFRGGLAAALRLHSRLYKSLQQKPVFSTTGDVEILIGKRVTHDNGQRLYSDLVMFEWCATLIIDGYIAESINCGAFTNKSENLLQSLERQAEEFADAMNKFGLKSFVLVEGFRIRFSTDERIPCEKLSKSQLGAFEGGLRKKFCRREMRDTSFVGESNSCAVPSR